MIKYLKKIFNKDKYLKREILKIINNAQIDEYIKILDVGAAGEIKSNWSFFEPLLDYVGFEPDDRSYKNLINRENICRSYQIKNTALWNNNERISINLVKKITNSSYYLPNKDLLKNYPDSQRFDVVGKIKIDAKTLDSLNIKNINFIKIDVQGAELKILEGGKNSLKDCMGIEAEVSFIEIYKNQPLFGDIYNYAINNNFMFVTFSEIINWKRKSTDVGRRQMAFADAVFLKSPEYMLEKYSNHNEILFKYAIICISYNLYGFCNLIKENMTGNLKEVINKIYAIKISHDKNRRQLKKIINYIKKIF